jgi:hypothetical protein
MIRGTKSGWLVMSLVGLCAGAACADEGGLLRVSDSPPPSSNTAPALPAPPAVQAQANGTDAAVGAPCDGDGGAPGRARLCGSLQAILEYNPAAGFRPPETVAIDRDAVIYYRYWPARWYGQAGFRLAPSFPMVYMPTDTTQLGVYYARVPQWLPNPAMYPRPPRPDEWNRRVTRPDLAGGGNCYAAESGPSTPTGEPVLDEHAPYAPSSWQPTGNLRSVPQRPLPPPSPMAPPTAQNN